MAKVTLYNVKGEKTGDLELKDQVFAVKPKDSVVHEVYTAMLGNMRQAWAHAKDRSERRGGGRKPWRQKGTGRARHGSIRSPLWRGGGVTFGPQKAANYAKKINKKIKRLATAMCLSDKVNDKKLIVLEALPEDGKTKTLAALRAKLPGAAKSSIILTDKKNEMILRASNNIEDLDVDLAGDASVVDLLHHQYIIITKDGIKALEKRLA